MMLKYFVVLALLLSGMSACSDDDDAMNDPCQAACSKLNACGTGVTCGSGVTVPTSTCASNCKKSQAVSAANCILQVPSCQEIDQLQNCASDMPCG